MDLTGPPSGQPWPEPVLGSGLPLARVARLVAEARRLDLTAAAGGALPALLAEIASGGGAEGPGRLLVVTEDEAGARRMADDLRYHLACKGIAGAGSVLALPAEESSPYDDLVPDRRVSLERAGALLRLVLDGDWRFAVVSAAALQGRVMPRDRFEAACVPVAVGDRLSREDLLRTLDACGYRRTPVVEEPGTCSVRGAVVDVFPPCADRPARIETFGDEVERIRSFDPENQATAGELAEIWLHPVGIAAAPPGEAGRGAVASRVREICDAVDLPTSRTDLLIEDILAGRLFVGAAGFAPAFHDPLGTIFDYLPADLPACVDAPAAVRAVLLRRESQLALDHDRLVASGRPAFPVPRHLLGADEVLELLGRRRLLLHHPVAVAGETAHPLERCDDPVVLGAAATNGLAARVRPDEAKPGDADTDPLARLAGSLARLIEDGYRLVLVARSRALADRLGDLLEGRGLHLLAAGDGPWPGRPGLRIDVGDLARGCLLPGDGAGFIPEEEIFGRRTRRRRAPSRRRPVLDDLRGLAPGDLMVHAEHGIGRYEGLVRQRIGAHDIDFLLLTYRDGDRLYLPVYRLDQVHKYEAGGETAVRLDRLGGQTFAPRKEQVRRQALEFAARLLDLYSRREAAERKPVDPPDDLYRAFEAAFPFEETADQARAIDEVTADLEGPRPMDRLICGDVGFGKTEVALRAAFRVVTSGRQVAVLVPTTVLAQQHYQTFRERFAALPVRVEMMSRFRSDEENRETVRALKEGRTDIVIGTHRLLSKDVHWKRLGLLVIDEEHRFGVAHKERIRDLRADVDTLVLTATPIPRTLHMAYVAVRDLSLITTAPVDRRPIRTVVCHDDPDLLRQAMERELARDGQVFFVHNRVRDIGRVAERVRALVPGARVAVGHGQMKEDALERVMLDFVSGSYDVLVCTSIIESGLDIPRANTIIIDRADTFGLAQLYQLRGRVGRGGRQAHALLVVPPLASLGGQARERVEALLECRDLGSGFVVATRDLEIRGAGNLLGAEQSGSVNAVGFETYCELLAEAVEELRGRTRAVAPEPELTFEHPGYLPEELIPDLGLRLQAYKRLASAPDEAAVEEIAADLEDRFGPLTGEAGALVGVMRVKAACRELGVAGIEVAGRRIVVHLGTASRVDPAHLARLVREARGRLRLTEELKLVFAFPRDDPPDARAAIHCLRALAGRDRNSLIS
jgi:transcription-repair coupling factor (superfamily II helicase)